MRKYSVNGLCLIIFLFCVSVPIIVFIIFKSNYDTKSFIDDMKHLGYGVEQMNTTEGHELNSSQTILIIGNAEISVYEYKDVNSLKKAVSWVNGTGDITGKGAITWVSYPHFYKKNKIIVIYYGNDYKINSDLKKIMGKPFSGE